MTDSFKTNKRLGIKIPRSILLPPYLLINPYFTDFTDSIDSVFGTEVDEKIGVIANLRNMWVQNPTTEGSAVSHTLVANDEWSTPERSIVVQQVNLLGMKLRNGGVVSDDAYQTISRFVGLYWFGKGTHAFIDFINYCLSSDLKVTLLWTENYQDFLPEGDAGIGTPVWDGGTWYPTTHVTIVAGGGLKGLDIRTLQSFFYEIANYNLVLKAVDASFDMPIVTSDHTPKYLAVGIFAVNEIAIANFKNRGAPPPPTNILQVEKLPSTYYAMGGVDADFATAFLLAQPSGWMYLDDGIRKVPIYSQFGQVVTDESDIGIQLLGSPKPGEHYDLLYGPVTWVPIPGSSRSVSRIPSFTTSSYTIKDGVKVEARAVGVRRNKLLTNPLGFVELNPGQFVPYW